jgi:hypothetical protein
MELPIRHDEDGLLIQQIQSLRRARVSGVKDTPVLS